MTKIFARMSDAESRILARELGKLGGAGAKWVARFLPSVPFEATLDLPASSPDVHAVAFLCCAKLAAPIQTCQSFRLYPALAV